MSINFIQNFQKIYNLEDTSNPICIREIPNTGSLSEYLTKCLNELHAIILHAKNWLLGLSITQGPVRGSDVMTGIITGTETTIITLRLVPQMG